MQCGTAVAGDLNEGRSGRVRLGASFAFEQKHFLAEVIALLIPAYNTKRSAGQAGGPPRTIEARDAAG